MQDRLQVIRDKFVTRLAELGGERALRAFFRDAFRTDSPEMAAYNQTVAEIIAHIANEDPFVQLAALTSFLRPRTHKMHHNALRYTPHYAEAWTKWRERLRVVMLSLPRDIVDLLTPEWRHLAWRFRALERHRSPERWQSNARAGWVGVLKRDEDEDRWRIKVKVGGQWWEGEYWLRTGHLSPHKLELVGQLFEAADGTRVLALVVRHRIPCERKDCQLPAAMEFVRREDRWVPSPWRVRADFNQALYPMVGRNVRQGDVVFHVIEDEGVPTLTEWMLSLFQEVDDTNIPTWLRSVVPGGAVFKGVKYHNRCPVCDQAPGWCETVVPIAVYEPTYDQPLFTHPDHYAVKVVGDEKPIKLIIAHQAAGVTQYVRRTSPVD